ncbi:DUF309 domain-containing protein [Herbaspirillum sp. ST 5-3]|uniref:DUF309 domain-containing protein n=1 Tax=Oxalobacteraceae TaxID=75682 RepID=UPI0010A37170|nr:DUF309 domain-containing protein [Herbaspirillum sp. ST 5-3]
MNHEFAWDELALLWDGKNFGSVHDWLGERWNYLIQTRPDGHEDKDARFLQGLAFAALALHFTQNRNQEGAALLADDALQALSAFLPAYRGVQVTPVMETMAALRPLLDGLKHDAGCPVPPSKFNKLVYLRDAG